ncbi:uncharacterized protein ARMOST_18970 [Armillaria ostoyae]|uniref:Uncharacterized protein n=1 Tax=Armillaria ostoyae TaxID=47428 RepID=A0A284S381_ARMOS|nr:uncharacterized protein ARMOST_18970 [Armillaria ostoyae]
MEAFPTRPDVQTFYLPGRLRGKIFEGTLSIFIVGPLGVSRKHHYFFSWRLYSQHTCLHMFPITDLGRVPDCARTDVGTLVLTAIMPMTPLSHSGKHRPKESCLLRDHGEMCQALLDCCSEYEPNTIIPSVSCFTVPCERGCASTCPVLRQRIFTRTERLTGYHHAQEKLVDLGYRPDFVAMPEGKITHLFLEHHEQLQSWWKSLPPMLVQDSDSDYTLPLRAQFLRTLSHPKYHPQENVVHSEVWEPSTEQQVVDYTLQTDSLLSPEEKSSQVKLAQNVIICKDCTDPSHGLNQGCRKNKLVWITPFLYLETMSHPSLYVGYDYLIAPKSTSSGVSVRILSTTACLKINEQYW